MDLKSYNKALYAQCKRALDYSFVKDIEPGYDQFFYCSDTDTVQYKILADKDKFCLYFFFVDLENVWKFIEPYFRQHYYQNFSVTCSHHNNRPSLQIRLNAQGFASLNKSTPIPQEVGVTTGKKVFDPLIDILSKRLASIKRHFLASPFELMLETAKANANDKGNRSVPNFSFYIKAEKKEKVWLAFEKNQITVYFGLHFQDRFEQQLGKIFFSVHSKFIKELVDAKKHVQNSPAVSVSEKEFPRLLTQSFPQEKNQKYSFANGIVGFTIFGNLLKSHRTISTFLAGFRNYSYYHIQAWKVYLHSRVLRRIGIIQKDLTLAEIQPFAQK